MDACPEVEVNFTAIFTFGTGADKMVGVNLLDGAACLLNPCEQRFLALLAECTGLVAYLP